jgi:diguanylate cyclase (GGDEF)-like protein
MSKQANTTNRKALNLIFSLIIGLMLLFSFLTFHNINNYLHSNKWAFHTYEVIDTSNNLLVDMLEAQALVRAYYITNDRSYLVNMDFFIKDLNTQFSQLKNLTRDNQTQYTNIKKLEPLLTARKANLDTVVNLKNNQKGTNNTHYIAKGQFLSEEIKRLIDTIQEVESQLLKNRSFTADFSLRSIVYTILVGNFISLLTLLFIMFLFNRQLFKSVMAEKETKLSQTLLNGIINGSNDPIVALDKNHRFIAYNAAYEIEFKKLFNKQIRLGSAPYDYLQDDEQCAKLKQFWNRALQGESFTVVERMGQANSQLTTYEFNFSSILDDNHQLIGAAQVIRNIEKTVEAHHTLMESKKKAEDTLIELRQRNVQINEINELVGLLQLTSTMDEVILLIKRYVKRLLPNTGGKLYVLNSSRNYLQKSLSWNNPGLGEDTIFPEACWGLKQGKPYHYLKKEDMLPCPHLKSAEPETDYFCIPLLAHNDVLGLLYIEYDAQKMENTGVSANQQALITNIANQISLALANFKLKESLRVRAIRDPLTGLYNRGYLAETLFRELQRAERQNVNILIVMLDIDHFKFFNDEHGHPSGDHVLKELGFLLQEQIRASDLACRYGGEEFLLMFYNLPEEEGRRKIERIKTSISELNLSFSNHTLGPITASFGASIFPKDGKKAEELIEKADKALYVSKKTGRNKISFYQSGMEVMEVKENFSLRSVPTK